MQRLQAAGGRSGEDSCPHIKLSVHWCMGIWVYSGLLLSACLEMPSKKRDRGTVQYGGRGREGATGKTLFNIKKA